MLGRGTEPQTQPSKWGKMSPPPLDGDQQRPSEVSQRKNGEEGDQTASSAPQRGPGSGSCQSTGAQVELRPPHPDMVLVEPVSSPALRGTPAAMASNAAVGLPRTQQRRSSPGQPKPPL